jgi:MFS transporter, SP family, general alpha glucoside:H+ symporter
VNISLGFETIPSVIVHLLTSTYIRSPWWLVRKERSEKALQSLRRLGYSENAARTVLGEIRHTLEQIRQETEGATYLECFRRSNLRRTIISIAPLTIQAFCGAMFTSSYNTYYAQLAGFSTQMSYRLSVGQQVLSIAGNVVSWFLVDRIGRRSLIMGGVAALSVCLWLMGGLAVAGTVGTSKAAVSTILIYSFAYNVGIGAVCFTILTESSTSRLRMKTIAIGLALQNSVYLGWSFALPYLFNPDHLNLGGQVGFIFGGTSVVCLTYLWFYQPETRNRSYLELDEMFIKGVKARDFKSYRSNLDVQTEILQNQKPQ